MGHDPRSAVRAGWMEGGGGGVGRCGGGAIGAVGYAATATRSWVDLTVSMCVDTCRRVDEKGVALGVR